MRDFTQGSIVRQVISFSIPLLIANLLQSGYNIINAIWVGRILGANALAAVTSPMPLIMMLVSLLIGMGVATNIIIAQAFGAGQMDVVKRCLSTSLVTSLVLCLLISAGAIVFAGALLDLVNTPGAVRHDALTFFRIICGGLIFQFIYNWFSSILRGLGDSQTPMLLMFISTALNIVLVPVFITGGGFMPGLGVAGAATGTLTSNFLSLVAGYFYIRRKNELFRTTRWLSAVNLPMARRIFAIGIPASLQMMVTSLAGTVIIALVNHYGPVTTAAFGIGMQIDQLALMPAMTIGIAISSMAGQNLGAGLFDRVRRILAVSLLLSLTISAVFFCWMFWAPRSVAALFTRDNAVIEHAAVYFRIVSFTYITYAIMFALHGVVRASGDTLMMLVMTVVAIILFRIPLAWFFSQKTPLGEQGIWWAMLASTLVGILLNTGYYLTGRWKRLNLLQPSRQAG